MSSIVLDAIDRSIIEALSADGRASYASLGPAVGLSQAAVRQRVQRLMESGVLRVVARTDPRALGLGAVATLGIEVDGDVGAAEAALVAMGAVRSATRVFGRFDLLVEVAVVDAAALVVLVDREVAAVPGVRHTEVLVHAPAGGT